MKGEFSSCAQEIINNTKWNIIKGKAVSEKDQDLVDTIEAHKSMAWFELDELAEFGKMIWQKEAQQTAKATATEKGSFTQFFTKKWSLYFHYKKRKAKISNNTEANDDISTLTQATQMIQGTYVTRMVEIEIQIDKFKADIKSHP